MPRYKVGDKCLVLPNVTPGCKEAQQYIGTTVTLKKFHGFDSPWSNNKFKNWWEVEEAAGKLIFSESVLQKIDPPKREDLTLGSWDLCPWTPEKIHMDRLEVITEAIGK